MRANGFVRGAAVLGPVRRKADLGDAAMIGPAGGNLLSALRRFAMHQHHVRMLGMHLVELVPDQLVIVVVGAAGDGDLRPGG